MNERRVLLVGLDAACFEQLDPLLAEGRLPNLARLLDEGIATALESTTPPWTPSAWPSIVTGTTPWTHGIYDFHHYDKSDNARLVSAREIAVPFLWEILDASDRSSVVVNVPVTHPVHEFDGSLVPGYLAPQDCDYLVDGQPRPLTDLDGEYRIYPAPVKSRDDRCREYERLIDARVAAAEHLGAVHDWSFMMVQFQNTDAVFHSMGHDREAVARVYERVDDAVGSLLELVGDGCNVFVVSDHGMHRYNWVFHCNSWLADRGYVTTSTDAERRTWNETTMEALQSGDSESTASLRDSVHRAMEGVLTATSRFGVTPQRIERALSVVDLDDRISRLLPEELLVTVVDAGEHVDWRRSAAYCRTSSALGIRCNVAGRDPGGVIPPEEFDDIRAALVEELRNVCGPSGRPIFEQVYDRHAVHGSSVENERSAPDVIFRPAEMKWEVSDIIRDRTFDKTTMYNHQYYGLFVASGPDIDSDASAAALSPSVVNVAPTILRLLGVEPPETVEGRPLSSLVGDAEYGASPPTVADRRYFSDHRRADVSDTVRNHLREMGYIE